MNPYQSYQRLKFDYPHPKVLRVTMSHGRMNTADSVMHAELVNVWRDIDSDEQINAAIITESRGSDGVGLAIASNLARSVADALMKDGRVRRGFLGVRPLDFDDRLVEALRRDRLEFGSLRELLDFVGLEEARGVFVYVVEPESPAWQAGSSH